MKWSATFDAKGQPTLTPDTPETRRDFERTWNYLHSGNAKIEGGSVQVVPKDQESA